MLSLNEVITELEALEVLRQTSKARSMIWDVNAKERLAWLAGLPINFYYHMDYENWIKLKNNS